jgi:hypothetical protein
MEPQRYRCAPIAALLLAGASLALLPEQAPAQYFSAGLKMAPRDVNESTDRGVDERPRFERRKFEEARFELERAFEDRHVSRHEMAFDRRDHHGGFTSGLKMATREDAERDRPHDDMRHVNDLLGRLDERANPHSRIAEGARYLGRPADEVEQKKEHHAQAPKAGNEGAHQKALPASANHQPGDKKNADPVRTNAGPSNIVGNRVANNAAAPGVAKNGPGSDMNQPRGNKQDAGKAFDPARANLDNGAPGNLVGNRAANNPPVAAAAPASVKNGPGGQNHHGVKNGASNQGQQACAKQGHANQAANKNAPNRHAGKQNGGPGNLVGNRGVNQNAPVNAAANNQNPQAGNANVNVNANANGGNQGQNNPLANQPANRQTGKKNGSPGNLVGKRGANQNVPVDAAANNPNPQAATGNQACAKQGPGNFAGNKNANTKNGFANSAGTNKNGNASNFAQARQAPGNLAANRPANNANHQAGTNKNGAGNAFNQALALNGAGHSANAATVKTAPMQHAAHGAVAKQGHGNSSVGRRK